MIMNQISLESLSPLMKEALAPERGQVGIPEEFQHIGRWAFEPSPLWDFVIASKGDIVSPLYSTMVTGQLRRESIYSGLAELTDPSSKTMLSAADLCQALGMAAWLVEWVEFYRGIDAYVASFDLVMLKGRQVYRYLLPEDRFIFLCETQSSVEDRLTWACVPVISTVRSFSVGGLSGYAKALLSAGCFLQQGIALASRDGLELEIQMDGSMEVWLGTIGSQYFAVPAYLCPQPHHFAKMEHDTVQMAGRAIA